MKLFKKKEEEKIEEPIVETPYTELEKKLCELENERIKAGIFENGDKVRLKPELIESDDKIRNLHDELLGVGIQKESYPVDLVITAGTLQVLKLYFRPYDIGCHSTTLYHFYIPADWCEVVKPRQYIINCKKRDG